MRKLVFAIMALFVVFSFLRAFEDSRGPKEQYSGAGNPAVILPAK